MASQNASLQKQHKAASSQAHRLPLHWPCLADTSRPNSLHHVSDPEPTADSHQSEIENKVSQHQGRKAYQRTFFMGTSEKWAEAPNPYTCCLPCAHSVAYKGLFIYINSIITCIKRRRRCNIFSPFPYVYRYYVLKTVDIIWSRTFYISSSTKECQ